MRWVLFALSAPIAIAVNGLRVTLTGLMSEVDKQLAEGAFHSAEGFLMWAMAVGLLLLTHRLINAWVNRRNKGAVQPPPAAVWPPPAAAGSRESHT